MIVMLMEMKVHMMLDLGNKGVLGSLSGLVRLGLGVGLVLALVFDELVKSKAKGSRLAVASGLDVGPVKLELNLYSGMYTILVRPDCIAPGDEGEEPRARDGIISPRGRLGGVRRLAGWERGGAAPSVRGGTDVCPPI